MMLKMKYFYSVIVLIKIILLKETFLDFLLDVLRCLLSIDLRIPSPFLEFLELLEDFEYER